jgi:serine phosphatase RsbU (regulator of sigma subunit)/CHASE3 domain sensor protein
MTLRMRVLAVALAAAAVIVLLGAQLLLRYAETRDSVAEVVGVLAPASSAAADLAGDINNMERRLRIYVSSGDTGYRTLYEAAVTSALRNTEELDGLFGGRARYARLLGDVEVSLTRWLDGVGIPVESAMDDGDRVGAQGILDSPGARSAYAQLTADTFRLSAVLAEDEDEALAATAAAARRLAWAMGITLVVALLIPVASYVALRHHVLSPIGRLRSQLRRTATPGQHDAVIVPDGPPEIRDLGSDAEALRRALVQEIDESEAAREALAQEGPVVDAIRRELTARADPGVTGVQIAGVLRPAEGVLAGDFWDRLALPDGRAAAVICDVSGHGPRAGIVAMRMKTSLTLGLVAGQDLPQILHRSCDAFADEPGRFATVVVLVADPRTGRLEWVNAGHPAPRIVRAGGRIEQLAPTGPMVSWLIGSWTVGQAELGPADVCLAFTDGILESRDAQGAELGDDELDEHLRAAAGASLDPAEVTAQVLGQVRARAEDLGRDDVTLVALRMEPIGAGRIPTPRR